MSLTSPQFATTASNTINDFTNNINNVVDNLSNLMTGVEQQNNDILAKQQIQIDQLKEIQEKEKLLLTRSRMLQISQDRNAYKKKIIYTLLSIIFIIFILIILSYVMFKKRMSIPKNIR